MKANVFMILAAGLLLGACSNDNEPTDNAMAERQNGIFKVEWIYEQEMYRDKEQAINEINRMIDFYNNRRPHMSIGMECPMEVYKDKLPGKNLWRKRP